MAECSIMGYFIAAHGRKLESCWKRLYTVQCTVYSLQCTVYSVQCTVYSESVQCTVYSV